MIIKNHDYGNLVTNNNQIDTIMIVMFQQWQTQKMMVKPANRGGSWEKNKFYQSNDGGERFQAIKHEAKTGGFTKNGYGLCVYIYIYG